MSRMQGLDNFLPKVGRYDDPSSESAGVMISGGYDELIFHQDHTIQDIKVVADVPVGDKLLWQIMFVVGE